jgi:hypothetical protein
MFEAINYFVISKSFRKSQNATLTSKERISLHSAYNSLAESVTYETLESGNELYSIFQRNSFVITYVPLSGHVRNINNTDCPKKMRQKIHCHHVTAAFQLLISKGIRVKSVLKEITNAITVAIQEGKLEALLQNVSPELSIVNVASVSSTPSSINQSPSHVIYNRLNESHHHVSVSFVAYNFIGVRASGVVSGTTWYQDILQAVERLASKIINNRTINVEYIDSSSVIDEVVDVLCSSSQLGAFCQSFVVLFRVLTGTQTPGNAINQIVKSFDSAIDSGELQSELDLINPQSVYQIEQSYEANLSQLTLSPSVFEANNNSQFDNEGNARRVSSPATIYVAALAGCVIVVCVISIFMYAVKSNRPKLQIKEDGSSDADQVFARSGTVNDNHTGDTWHDGDEYYVQEFQYDTSPEEEAFRKSSLESTQTTMLTSTFTSNASRLEDDKFFEVFGTGDIDWGEANIESAKSQQLSPQKFHVASDSAVPSHMNVKISDFHNTILEVQSESSSGETSSSGSNSSNSSSGSNSISSSSNSDGDTNSADD